MPKTQLQPLQRVDEAEPPHERLLGASVRAEVPSDRLAVELDLEPDAERVTRSPVTKSSRRRRADRVGLSLWRVSC